MNIAFIVPMSLTNPHCAVPALILFFALYIKIRTLVMWDIILIVRWSSLSFGLLGNFTEIDLVRSSGMSPHLYISFFTSLKLSMKKSSMAKSISITILSDSVALSLLIFSSADLNSSFFLFMELLFLFFYQRRILCRSVIKFFCISRRNLEYCFLYYQWTLF